MSLVAKLNGDDLPETYRQLGPRDSRRRKLAILYSKAIEHLTNAAAHTFVKQQHALLAGQLAGGPVEHMHGPANGIGGSLGLARRCPTYCGKLPTQTGGKLNNTNKNQ
ncbi:hypothetical protein PPUJ20028_42040 [Pseudomonas putida]|uniref:Uncharacterized protein n=1 Tax=Pseudomonas putida TaxID=303 RepID=A0AA37RFV2_PSEPU|nr:hypothetical protein PPUJ20028_42040 [Pseudomonas putida]GLO37151.1 hypothetical protein PPUN14671_39870 [Pseudomonas putida]